MARVITENKNIMQSYIFTAAKYDFTAYEKRIMYRLVECAQDEIAGLKKKIVKANEDLKDVKYEYKTN